MYAVNGVSFHVDPAEVFALVGESGSGKSVSMLSVMGLVPTPPAVVEGSITFEGRELLGISRREMNSIRGKDIGMVFQDPMSSLNPVHPIGRQIAESVRLHSKNTSRKAAMERAIDLLDRVGIPNPRRRADDYPHEFSGGMRQRAMIAIALACNPRLLIADEPTTALDVTVQRQIVALVKELQSELGMSVVWITHDLGVVAEIADRIAVMYGGRILETGEATDLYARAQHPYTSGLLQSIPRTDTPITEWLPEIPGSPRPITTALTGCAFASRCPRVDSTCTESLPELVPVGSRHHMSACIHQDSIGDREELWPAVEHGHAESQETTTPIVRIDDLAVHFPVRRGWRKNRNRTIRAVDGVDLDVYPGRTLGVVGESGCGKSTLGLTLVGINEPTSGAVTVEGEPIDPGSGRHRKAIQMIFQDPFSSMNPGMRVSEVITEPLRIHGVGSRENRAETARDLLEKVGLSADDAHRHPHEFSGGQRQRIAIARALAAEPKVIVCDEPVSALDVSVQAQIVNLLRETQQDTGVALIFIAHDLAVVRHVSHEIAVMYLGQVVERAPRDLIYEDPKHPYTQALLAAVPVPDPDSGIDLAPSIEGDLPDPADPPPGCRFHSRCPIARPGLCDIEQPELRELDPGRWVACHLADPTIGPETVGISIKEASSVEPTHDHTARQQADETTTGSRTGGPHA